MKYICLLFCVSLAVQAAVSQNISNHVVASGGKSATAGTFNLSYTVGELVVSTLNTSNNTVTQGFHQTYTTNNASVDGADDPSFTIDVYPNPTVDGVNVSIETEKDFAMQALVFNSYGQLLLTTLFTNASQWRIDLASFTAGTYYIRLVHQGSMGHIKTFKIQKLTNQ